VKVQDRPTWPDDHRRTGEVHGIRVLVKRAFKAIELRQDALA
jgi:hypothetical protein